MQLKYNLLPNFTPSICNYLNEIDPFIFILPTTVGILITTSNIINVDRDTYDQYSSSSSKIDRLA